MAKILKFKKSIKTGAVIDGVYYNTSKWHKCDDCIYCQSLINNGEYGVCTYSFDNITKDIIKHVIHKEDCNYFKDKKQTYSFTKKLELFLNYFNISMIYNYNNKTTLRILIESFKKFI